MSYKSINVKLRVCEMGYSFVIVSAYVTNLLTNVWAFNTIVVASMGGGWPHAGSRGPALSPGLGRIALRSWAGHFTLTVPLSTQVYKWITANLMLGVALRWPGIQSRGE